MNDWSLIPDGQRIFLFTAMSRPTLGPAQSPIQWVPGAVSLGLEELGSVADHLPPSSAEVKNVESCTTTPPYVFMVWCIVKYMIHLHGVALS
jgi:hypothetical protein